MFGLSAPGTHKNLAIVTTADTGNGTQIVEGEHELLAFANAVIARESEQICTVGEAIVESLGSEHLVDAAAS